MPPMQHMERGQHTEHMRNVDTTDPQECQADPSYVCAPACAMPAASFISCPIDKYQEKARTASYTSCVCD
eukprot:175984-Amphidinium_carterae.1